ncbi:UNVERIFIED_CONTAM: hypothetical protein GTU68_026308 [Idotea baltica]|nr:hypothetical protein [Idotea baltica]
MQAIYIINGPNLNLLGKREIDIYGNVSFDLYFEQLKHTFGQTKLYYFQSNHEGRIIDKLQEIGFSDIGIVMNAAGYTHTSIALGDTVAAIEAPVVEVHISDISNREDFRRHSYVKQHAVHFINGKGLAGYDEAINFLIQ